MPQTTATTTTAPRPTSAGSGRSPSTSHEPRKPATGTAIEKGATCPVGCFDSSQVQTPEPTSVATTTM